MIKRKKNRWFKLLANDIIYHFYIRFKIITLLLLSLNLCYAKTLNIAIEKWPEELDAVRGKSLEAVVIGNQVYETLFKKLSSGEIVSRFIESWEYDTKHKKIKMKLKNNIYFSDGVRLETSHIKFIFDKYKSSRLKRPHCTLEEVAFFKSINKVMFEIILKNEDLKFLERLTNASNVVVRKLKGRKFAIGTGPYVIDSVQKKEEKIILKKNEYYNQNIDFSELIFTTKNTKNIDISLVEQTSKEGLVPYKYFDTEVHYVGIFSDNNLLNKLSTRLYLLSLIDDSFIKSYGNKYHYKLGGLIPYGQLGYSPDLHTPHPTITPNTTCFSSKRRHKHLANKALLTEKLNCDQYHQEINVSYYAEFHKNMAYAYCDKLKKIGFNCRVEKLLLDQYFKKAKEKTLQIYFARQKSTGFSAKDILSFFTSKSPFNLSFTENKDNVISQKIDTLFNHLSTISSIDKDAIKIHYQRLDKFIISHGLAKPFRYGGEKIIWHSPNIILPRIETNGPYGLMFHDVKLMNSQYRAYASKHPLISI